jgi:plastocyanin
MGRGNDHLLIPQIATIKAGGSVNFIISGGHVVAVYDDGTKPENINLIDIEPAASCPTTAGGVLSDSNGRIYRGPCFAPAANNNTTDLRRDGVEVVQFTKPGTYLVICARKNHFAPLSGGFEMYGFVKVLPGK